MADYNLYLGGGDCATYECMPLNANSDEWEAYLSRVGATAQGVGSDPQYNYQAHLGQDLFPASDVAELNDAPKMMAAHRGNCYFANSRILDFRAVSDHELRMCKGWNNQDALRRWMLKNFDTIAVDDALSVVLMPAKHLHTHLFWENMCTIPGLVYDIVLKHSGTVLVADIDGSVLASGYVDMPDAHKYSHNVQEQVQIVIKSMPPENTDKCEPGKGKIDGMVVMVSVPSLCPVTGK